MPFEVLTREDAWNHRSPGAWPIQETGHFWEPYYLDSWLGSRVVSVLDSSAEGPGFKSQSRRCRVTVLGKLLTAIVPLFTKQQNR